MSKQQWITANLKTGELYAGLILGKDGSKDYHLILLPDQANDVNWAAAMAWAKTVGGELPTRREQSLLFANLKDRFEPRLYWSCEKYASCSGYAWGQDFRHGSQSYYREDYKFRARAVRGVEI